MRRTLAVAALGLLLTGCESDGGADTRLAASHQSHRMILPDQVNWSPGPPGLPPGGKFAVLEGDPTKPGFFTMRGLMPDGYRIPPHWHPKPERLTILSGTLYLGAGDHLDASAATALPAGSYATMPPGVHHFAFAKGETVIQLSGVGPWGITYVDPADDPRKAGK